MNEEVQLIYDMTRERMEKAIEHLDSELIRIRAGKANVHILEFERGLFDPATSIWGG